jgi:nucleoside-diphosphate-sugar epimerase
VRGVDGTHSIAKAGRMIGFEPKVELEEGMRRSEARLGTQGIIPGRRS